MTTEIKKLLDKLYNLRGSDSVILAKMEEEKKKATETKERTENEKKALQDDIANYTEEERILGEEGEKLKSALSKIDGDSFKIVLEKLKIDFNPDKISKEVSDSLPKTIEKVQDEIKTAKEELVKVENEMNMAIATIEELLIRKDESLENQSRLNEYFELALKGNSNITRDSITTLLEKFEYFTEEEIREAAKIIMFPEDALYEYEDKLKNTPQPGKSISEVFAEAKENIGNIENSESDKRPASPKEELIHLLNEVGFDYLDFTTNDIEKILANYNEDGLKNNVAFAKDAGINLDLFIDNVEFLYDREFKEKINRLMEIGKETMDIYLNPNILKKYNMKDLDETIDKIVSSGLDPKKVPLIAY